MSGASCKLSLLHISGTRTPSLKTFHALGPTQQAQNLYLGSCGDESIYRFLPSERFALTEKINGHNLLIASIPTACLNEA